MDCQRDIKCAPLKSRSARSPIFSCYCTSAAFPKSRHRFKWKALRTTRQVGATSVKLLCVTMETFVCGFNTLNYISGIVQVAAIAQSSWALKEWLCNGVAYFALQQLIQRSFTKKRQRELWTGVRTDFRIVSTVTRLDFRQPQKLMMCRLSNVSCTWSQLFSESRNMFSPPPHFRPEDCYLPISGHVTFDALLSHLASDTLGKLLPYGFKGDAKIEKCSLKWGWTFIFENNFVPYRNI